MGIFRSKSRSISKGGKPGEETFFDIPGLGAVKIVISCRARRINLTVKADGTVRLAVPYGVPAEKGLQFLDGKKEWILRTRQKYPQRDTVILPPYSTRNHTLQLRPSGGTTIRTRITANEIIITYPASLTVTDPDLQKAVKNAIEEAWRAEAKAYLPSRLLRLSADTGLQYRTVTIRNTVSKWGSCSARNDISLSLHLMRLPDRLIDYILLHELAHTVHKNHGPRFHCLLDQLTGGHHGTLRRELKNYHTRW